MIDGDQRRREQKVVMRRGNRGRFLLCPFLILLTYKSKGLNLRSHIMYSVVYVVGEECIIIPHPSLT